jgi:hypothetical protein
VKDLSHGDLVTAGLGMTITIRIFLSIWCHRFEVLDRVKDLCLYGWARHDHDHSNSSLSPLPLICQSFRW